MKAKLDPVTLAVMNHRLAAIADTSGARLARSEQASLRAASWIKLSSAIAERERYLS